MATMFPEDARYHQPESYAERRLYPVFAGLPNDFTVYWNGVDAGPDLVNSNAFAYTIYSGFLTGTSLPEPGTLVLFGSGIVGMAGLLRRKLNL